MHGTQTCGESLGRLIIIREWKIGNSVIQLELNCVVYYNQSCSVCAMLQLNYKWETWRGCLSRHNVSISQQSCTKFCTEVQIHSIENPDSTSPWGAIQQVYVQSRTYLQGGVEWWFGMEGMRGKGGEWSSMCCSICCSNVWSSSLIQDMINSLHLMIIMLNTLCGCKIKWFR